MAFLTFTWFTEWWLCKIQYKGFRGDEGLAPISKCRWPIKGGGTCEVMFCVWWWKNRVSHIQKINHKVRFQYLYVDLLPVLFKNIDDFTFGSGFTLSPFTMLFVLTFDSLKLRILALVILKTSLLHSGSSARNSIFITNKSLSFAKHRIWQKSEIFHLSHKL